MKNKEVKELIETNKQINLFIDYLLDQYDFKGEEIETLSIFKEHMTNLNFIFGKIKK